MTNFNMLQEKVNYLKQNLLTKSKIPYYLSFFIPFIIFFMYFALHKFNILTVDLGQQYVDFFSFLRNSLFTHPSNLIYSFQNGLGNSMLGTDAYYLLSPFNLILFLFSKNQLPIAILLLITLKIGAMGLSSFFYWKKRIPDYYAISSSLAYALCGYVIANHFNLMWLDSAILLPLLINEIDHCLYNEENHLTLLTFLLWLTNFYTGFMALLFGFLYFLSQLVFTQFKKEALINYFKASILGSLISAFILLPVLFEMLAGKASSPAHWSFDFQFPPFEELSKLALGAYSFHEMEAGMPNIYLTMPFLLFIIAYFTSNKIDWKPKLANLLLFIFLVFSLFWTPLVLVWHLGQFPVWYPGRFSFILIFFSLNLATLFIKKQSQLSIAQKVFIAILATGLSFYLAFITNKIEFLNNTNLIISCLFLALAVIYICFLYNQNRISGKLLFGIIIIEITVNTILSLNNLAYQNNADYQNFSRTTNQVTQYLKKTHPGFYRVEKTFYRSDDDPFTANYYGISNFNSISDQKVLTLLQNLGYLHNSNSYTNYGGSPITDNILGIKYYLTPNYAYKKLSFDNQNERLDVNGYHFIKQFLGLNLYQNQTAFPLLFLTPDSTTKIHFDEDNPTRNQVLLFNKITANKSPLFHSIILPSTKTINATPNLDNNLEFTQKNISNNASISFTLTPSTQNSYYLELPDTLNNDQTDLFINGTNINIDTRDPQSRLINFAYHQKGQKIKITFNIKNRKLDLNGINLWELNNPAVSQLSQQFLQNQPSFSQKGLIIRSHFSTDKTQTLATTIPFNRNWLILDNGHLVKKKLFANTFLSIQITKGKHDLKLVYVPFALIIGVIISLFTLIFLKKRKC